ncbi:hypothetical protein MTR67_026173 [Solanum verrucosum]|uniref:Integrase zinc-binding domain-containing protein n=1 Tax=Solanum verrucosum TaxID=315347 RepID=A0AAF0R161_SOLVR|nr:hypothetical protein MTR67_026173 [Solanum verrucosum]
MLTESNDSRFSFHSVVTKMYRDLERLYWWPGKKKYIAEFVANYQNCQDVVMRFNKKGKLSSRYVRPFEILDYVGLVAYRLAIPHGLSGVHQVFQVSMLKKYYSDRDYIIKWDLVLLDTDLSYEEEPIAISDRDVQKLRTKEIMSVKVQWKYHVVE